MPRPRKRRRVGFMPKVTLFKPAVSGENFQETSITFDEIEALRLKDLKGLDQETCANAMGVAQSTFQRILTSARRKISRAILEGRAIRIEGGDYKLVPRELVCDNCGYDWLETNWYSPEKDLNCPRCGRQGRRWRGGRSK